MDVTISLNLCETPKGKELFAWRSPRVRCLLSQISHMLPGESRLSSVPQDTSASVVVGDVMPTRVALVQAVPLERAAAPAGLAGARVGVVAQLLQVQPPMQAGGD